MRDELLLMSAARPRFERVAGVLRLRLMLRAPLLLVRAALLRVDRRGIKKMGKEVEAVGDRCFQRREI